MKNKDRKLIVFSRYPIPGSAKTRMIPALGPKGAALLHRRLAEHTVGVARDARERCGISVVIAFTGAPSRAFRAWLGQDLQLRQQHTGDLGTRMQCAIHAEFSGGADHVIAIGTDVPGISPDILQQATAALGDHDIVFGPAADGGYYLIGLNRCYQELFTGIDWGTEQVAEQTRKIIRQLGVTWTELPVLSDVDRPEDLYPLKHDSGFADIFTGNPRLSVIIPTLNEAEQLGSTLARIRQGGENEIIVADGESRDTTRQVARENGAMVVETGGGRAAQLNAGAAAANGQQLLFLHADTLLPDGYQATIRRTLSDPATVAGAFRFRTDGRGLGMRLVEWGTNVRSSMLGWPYGDQAIFLEKRIFDETGGFTDLPIMEDFDLVRRLRRRGRVVTVPETVITSARRWRSLGLLRTVVRNQAMILGYFAGISPDRLAQFYRGKHRDAHHEK